MAAIESYLKKNAAPRKPMARWVKLMAEGNWTDIMEMRRSLSTADAIKGTNLTCFNIGGNSYRLIALVSYQRREIVVQEILTHTEYDKKYGGDAMIKHKKINGRGGAAQQDDYFKLVQRFPLRPLRSEDEYDQAVALLGELVGQADAPGLSPGESDYADALGHFVEKYDQQHSSILKEIAAGRGPTPIEILKYLMEENAMKTADLGRLLGSGQGQASLILNGKRELSKANIRTLAEHFKVSPALFI